MRLRDTRILSLQSSQEKLISDLIKNNDGARIYAA